jgi:hypothetical protein
MTQHDSYADDIPFETAIQAHRGTSFVPEKRGESERAEYANTLQGDYDSLAAIADTEEKQTILAAEFARYRERYRERTLAWLNARGRMVSTMIAGPANFPAHRQQKIGDTAHKRLQELIDFRDRALSAIRKRLCPESGPIMSGDADAAKRLAEQIADAEALQDRMKRVNAVHKRYLKRPESLETADLSDADKHLVRSYKPAYSWEPHPFPPYRLKNNNANIRRMKHRLAQVERAQATPETVSEAAGIRVEDCPPDNRVRLFFPGKPSADVRSDLKKHGFRWAPSLGCWQAYRNPRSLAKAQEMLEEKP